MTTYTPAYQAAVTLTCTLASLATSVGAVAGRESTAQDNKDTDDAVDALVGGKVTVGTTPTVNTQIEIWAYGSYDDVSFSGGASGSDAALTPSDKSLMKLLCVIPSVAATSNVTHTWGPFSIAQAFGGMVPPRWGIWISHNTGVNLNSTAGNHEIKAIPVKMESA